MTLPCSSPQIIHSKHPRVQNVAPPRTNLASFLRSNPNNLPDTKPAYIRAADGKILTRGDIFSAVGRTAYSLAHTLGVQPGDRIAIFSHNSTWYPVAVHANLTAGAVSVTLSPAYSAEELAHPLADSRPRYVYAERALLPTVRKAWAAAGLPERDAATGRRAVWVLDDCDEYERGEDSSGAHEADLRVLVHAAGERVLLPVEVPHPDTTDAFIGYSSGTSGKPKGVQLTHGNHTWLCQLMPSGRHGELDASDVALAVLPFQHIFALFHSVLFDLYFGNTAVVLPRFELGAFLRAIQRFRVNRIEVVPPILVLLAKSPEVDAYDLSSLKCLLSGAAPLSAELGDQVERRLRENARAHRYAGGPQRPTELSLITQGYGLTETSPSSHAAALRAYRQHTGSVGLLLPNLEARLIDDDGRDVAHERDPAAPRHLALSKRGELWLRGPTIMKGYLNNEGATADALLLEGDAPWPWFKTGDVAQYDVPSGHFYIVDRKKELIKYKGFQVAPAELEALLLEHADVADAAVVGDWSDDEATERPVAFVVLRGGPPPSQEEKESEGAAAVKTAQDVRHFVDARVASHKRLRGGVRVLEAIPKSPSGKILRRVLREMLKAERERGDGGGKGGSDKARL